ncbi:hypothetical protein [Mesorhizobium sp. CN2-181]|uniref:hypothetical protein n=1 Tax=Mesorhizobium yinganensis TaxID=3157707 RepID=UPI0032B76D45
MTMRAALEGFPAGETILIFTTLGHAYSGRLVDIDDTTVTIGRPDGGANITLNLGDISGARAQQEEAEPGT